MECEFCGEAACVTLAVVEQKSGARREMSLCPSCAQKMSFFFPNGLPFPNLDANSEDDNVACPVCGTTKKTFDKNEIVGCPYCYDFFQHQIFDIMEHAKIDLPFKGNLPKNFHENLLLQEDAEELKQKLQAAVEHKDYENAAFFRDELKKLSAMRPNENQEKPQERN